MNNRQRAMAILRYENYDRMPVVHFGYWNETLLKWYQEGHITLEEAKKWGDGNEYDQSVAHKLGFDFNWYTVFSGSYTFFPFFQTKVIEELGNGARKVQNGNGVVVLQKDGAGSIPAEIDHLLKDRAAWEELYLPKLQYSDARINFSALEKLKDDSDRQNPVGFHCGSLFGEIRNWLGVEGSSYLLMDDEDLYREIIDTVGNLCYTIAEKVLSTGAKFDFGHFWEDICFKNGPLVRPSVFDEMVGSHYKRITGLLNRYGLDIVSLDCDGMIDALIPTWFNNGVNTMFPIEVGTWNANIKPWREKYGKELRGVGGMDKKVFAYDYHAIDQEVERLKPLVELGGFIPCVDHRIAPDAKWENIQYYCERMRKEFGS